MDEGVSGVVVIINEEENVLEILGSPILRTAAFEVSSYLIDRYNEEKKEDQEKPKNRPAGTTCFLHPLPSFGLDMMTITQIDLYWSHTMRAVLSKRGRNLGYENPWK